MGDHNNKEKDSSHPSDGALNIYKSDDITIEEEEWLATVERLMAGLDAMLTPEQLEAQQERRRLVEQRYQELREKWGRHDNHQINPE
jgi:hypothetical protein